jgi:DNA-binding NarL/FixJ family response regulator
VNRSQVQTRVLVADGYPLFPGMQLVGQAEEGLSAVDLCLQHRPDVTLLDARLPLMNGIEATRVIRATWLRARVLVFSETAGDTLVRRALQAGAAGFLRKNISPEALIETLKRVHQGHQVIPPELALELASRLADRELSRRELEVLRMVALGNPNKRIATALDVSVDTIKAHLKAVLSKLGASDRTHAVTLALRRGLIDLSSQTYR